MPRIGLRCPRCGGLLRAKTHVKFTDPFEVEYFCKKCGACFMWHSWIEYYEACSQEEDSHEQKQSSFNPSIKGSVVRHEG